jgi:hypothetical protein
MEGHGGSWSGYLGEHVCIRYFGSNYGFVLTPIYLSQGVQMTGALSCGIRGVCDIIIDGVNAIVFEP